MPPLDVARGVGLLGSEAALREILDAAEASLASSLPGIRQALDAGDVKTVHHLLHGIKGYAPIFCTESLIEQVGHVEGLSKTEAAAVLRPLLLALMPELESLLLEIRGYGASGQ
jgi:HPt (histidine-containing phosphotransfer) domain-containing protein